MKDKKKRVQPGSFHDRMIYRLDQFMERGTVTMVVMLFALTLLFVLVLAVTVTLFCREDGQTFSQALWDSLANTINAWMLSSEDGSWGYLILMAAGAVVGLLFTSMLISILASAVEEKILSLKAGGTEIVEQGHIVVLGFCTGSYELLRQLCLEAGDRRQCIVIVGREEKEALQEGIDSNVEIPDRVRIRCRSLDYTNPTELKKLSLGNAKTVIINGADDNQTLLTVLAVSHALKEYPESETQIVTFVMERSYYRPVRVADEKRTVVLPIRALMARMIAHTCTQRGLSSVFRELLTFEGAELYTVSLEIPDHMTFGQLNQSLTNATALGYFREGKLCLNPDKDGSVSRDDRFVLLAEDEDGVEFHGTDRIPPVPAQAPAQEEKRGVVVVISGENRMLERILSELDWDESRLIVRNTEDKNELESLAQIADHIILLADDGRTDEENDYSTMKKLLLFRHYRNKYHRQYNISVQMYFEKNKNLLAEEDPTDFIVAADISAMMMAQTVGNPELLDVMKELLSSDGTEMSLLPAAVLPHCESFRTNAELRAYLGEHRLLYLGYTTDSTEDKESPSFRLNPNLHEEVSLRPEDRIIIMGKTDAKEECPVL